MATVQLAINYKAQLCGKYIWVAATFNFFLWIWWPCLFIKTTSSIKKSWPLSKTHEFFACQIVLFIGIKPFLSLKSLIIKRQLSGFIAEKVNHRFQMDRQWKIIKTNWKEDKKKNVFYIFIFLFSILTIDYNAIFIFCVFLLYKNIINEYIFFLSHWMRASELQFKCIGLLDISF